jgi:hypothetical protein
MARAGVSKRVLLRAGGDGWQLILADVAQLVEHSLGKGEVISSILIIGSRVEVAGTGKCRSGRDQNPEVHQKPGEGTRTGKGTSSLVPHGVPDKAALAAEVLLRADG